MTCIHRQHVGGRVDLPCVGRNACSFFLFFFVVLLCFFLCLNPTRFIYLFALFLVNSLRSSDHTVVYNGLGNQDSASFSADQLLMLTLFLSFTVTPPSDLIVVVC